jgi:hypothetical protein
MFVLGLPLLLNTTSHSNHIARDPLSVPSPRSSRCCWQQDTVSRHSSRNRCRQNRRRWKIDAGWRHFRASGCAQVFTGSVLKLWSGCLFRDSYCLGFALLCSLPLFCVYAAKCCFE